jgi:2-polyprenyl-3-methyl-5-hydroxy-6-metoxy-1,4-benzoquinol methylase
MKVGIKSQNLLEWIAVQSGIAPEPLAVGHFGYILSKFLLEAVDKGVFEAIGKKQCTIQEIATACNLHQPTLYKLLKLLASMDLVQEAHDKFSLTRKAKKWILKDSPHSLYWLLMFDNKVTFDWMHYVGEFLQTGKGLQYHDTFTREQWFYYEKAMEALAKSAAKEIVRKVPPLTNPTKMLDIGGAHGLYSAAFCKKYPQLHATVLDLPSAIEQAMLMEKDDHLKTRLHYKAGNILLDDIGTNQYDFILMASVAHHFTGEENKLVAAKVQAALKPGGYFTIMEVLSQDKIKKNMDMLGAIGDMFFALSSTSSTWKFNDINSWFAHAGLKLCKQSSFLFIPGYVALTAKKNSR